MTKLFSWIFLVLTMSSAIPTRAVKPHEPLESACVAFLAPLLLPLELDLLNYGGRRFEFCKNPKAWLYTITGAAAWAALVYCILKKYTPQNKYNWALRVKDESKSFLNGDSDLPLYLRCLGYLRSENLKDGEIVGLSHYYDRLKKGYTALMEAPDDIPDDVIFKQDCELLVTELEVLISQVAYKKALKIKQKLQSETESSFFCGDGSSVSSRIRSFVDENGMFDALVKLRFYHRHITPACSIVTEALEVPIVDNDFKQHCEQLAEELKEMLSKIELYTTSIITDWYENDFLGSLDDYQLSIIKWAAAIAGGSVEKRGNLLSNLGSYYVVYIPHGPRRWFR